MVKTHVALAKVQFVTKYLPTDLVITTHTVNSTLWYIQLIKAG